MRQYLCECLRCHKHETIAFKEEPFPEAGETIEYSCKGCGQKTFYTRVLTRKAMSELRVKQQEEALRQTIRDACMKYGFQHRFLYESVIISTPVSSWQFNYKSSKKTLRHESTVKINFETGNYAKTHEQFRDRKISCEDLIDYIAAHDKWRMHQVKESKV